MKYAAKKSELLGLLHTADRLKDPEALRRDGRSDLSDAADDYEPAVANGYSIEYLYIYRATGEQTLMIPLGNSTYQKQAQYHLGDVGSSILLRSFQNTRRELTSPPASTARRCRWTRTITLRKMVPSAKCWLSC